MSKDVSFTFTVEGAYGIKCAPHLGMGMIALVVVGDGPVDLEALRAVKMPKKAQERFEDIYAELQ
jgi:pseudoazurin